MRTFGRVLLSVVLGSCAFAWSANTCRADDANAAVRIVPPEGDGAKYWPRWRGPSGQGIVEPGGYPDKWSDTENVLWKVELPGAGNSSPIIWADRIFLTAAQDKGKKRSIICLSRCAISGPIRPPCAWRPTSRPAGPYRPARPAGGRTCDGASWRARRSPSPAGR